MKSRWWRGTKARPSLLSFILNSELEHQWAWDWSYSSPLQLGLVCNRLVDPVIWCVEFNTTDTWRWEDPWLSLASDVSVWSWAVSKWGRSWVSWVHLMFALETVHACIQLSSPGRKCGPVGILEKWIPIHLYSRYIFDLIKHKKLFIWGEPAWVSPTLN